MLLSDQQQLWLLPGSGGIVWAWACRGCRCRSRIAHSGPGHWLLLPWKLLSGTGPRCGRHAVEQGHPWHAQPASD